ncbi:NAD(P)-binding protein [Thozetella sp. PMI_491]|nr:NAD(P)-binding protein [Thozetella sp. PMI_491]
METLPLPTTDFAGKVVIVTGANVGLGLEAARHFARLGAAKVILGCRNTEKGESAKADIEATTATKGVVELWPLDLGSFESVKQFCRRADELPRLDILVENAGIAIGTHHFMEGFESTITTNVISTFFMALMVLPKLRRTAAQFNTRPHLVIVSSDAHVFAQFHERSEPNIFSVYRSTQMSDDRYNTSKLIEILVMRELVTRMDASGKNPVIVNTLNPGLCRSTLFRHALFPLNIVLNLGLFFFGRTAEMGSRTLLAAACGDVETHGQHMDSCRVANPSSFVRSAEGERVQKKVYEELMTILDEIQPGVSGNDEDSTNNLGIR